MPPKLEVPESIRNMSKETMMIVLAVAAMLVLILVVIYIASVMKRNNMQDTILQSKIIALDNREIVPFKIDKSAMQLPSAGGQEFSYSFWVYLSEQYEPTANYKVIFQRGNTAIQGKYSYTTTPLIFLDKSTNRLYVALSTNAVQSDMDIDSILTKNGDGQYTSNWVIGSVDYVPLQRWVNFTIVIKDDKLMVFMDGDMYTISSVTDLYLPTGAARPVLRDTTGDASIGDKTATVKGFLSYTRFFNYAMTQKDIQAIYEAGPTKRSILALLGLNNYGFRTPVYNMDDDAKAAA